MLTHDELVFCIQQKYPELIHGSDFLVGHALSPETGKQIAPARIVAWNVSEPMPTAQELDELVRRHVKNAPTFLAARKIRNERDRRLKDADALVYKAMDTGDMERMRLAGQYRQALRDVTTLPGFPGAFEWPQVPPDLVELLPANA